MEKHAHRVVGVRRVTRGCLVSQVLRAAGQHDDSCRAEETPCLLVLPRVSPPDPTSTAVLRTLPGHQGLCPALAELARVSLRESPPPPPPQDRAGNEALSQVRLGLSHQGCHGGRHHPAGAWVFRADGLGQALTGDVPDAADAVCDGLVHPWPGDHRAEGTLRPTPSSPGQAVHLHERLWKGHRWAEGQGSTWLGASRRHWWGAGAPSGWVSGSAGHTQQATGRPRIRQALSLL